MLNCNIIGNHFTILFATQKRQSFPNFPVQIFQKELTDLIDFLQSFARKNIFIFISLKFNRKDSANSRWFSVIAIFKLSNV